MNTTDLQAVREFWNRKASKEPLREQQDPNKTIHTDLLWRLIKRHLPAAGSPVLDAGGGTGRFSFRLAELGFPTTHLDLSPEMLDIAKQEATDRNMMNLDFVEGSITDLSRFPDRQFALVLCLDAPLSSCFRDYPRALDELIRVCADKLILCVFNRTGLMLNSGLNFDLIYFGRIRTMRDVYETGDFEVTDELLKLQNLMPSWHAFLPDELSNEITRRGFQLQHMCAPGTLSRFASKDQLNKLIISSEYEDYLTFEESFDSDKNILGMGSACASGLAAVAQRST
jgi:SAM-dependent methyltransferase